MLKHVTDETTGEGVKRGQNPTGEFFSSLLDEAPARHTAYQAFDNGLVCITALCHDMDLVEVDGRGSQSESVGALDRCTPNFSEWCMSRGSQAWALNLDQRVQIR